MTRKKESLGKKLKHFKRDFSEDKKRIMEEALRPGDDAEIDVNLTADTSLFEPFASEENADIHPDIYAYIERKAYYIPLGVHLVLHFRGEGLSKETKATVQERYRRHYSREILDKKDDLRSNFIKSLVLSIFGAIVLGVYLYLSVKSENALFLELLSVAGSFAVWESVDYFLIERTAIRHETMNTVQLAEATVVFESAE